MSYSILQKFSDQVCCVRLQKTNAIGLQMPSLPPPPTFGKDNVCRSLKFCRFTNTMKNQCTWRTTTVFSTASGIYEEVGPAVSVRPLSQRLKADDQLEGYIEGIVVISLQSQ